MTGRHPLADLSAGFVRNTSGADAPSPGRHGVPEDVAADPKPGTTGASKTRDGITARYARLVLRWRWPLLAALGLVTGAAVALLPGIGAQGGNLSGILSTSGPTIQVQIDAIRRFGLPLLTRIAVVQRDPEGLDPKAIARAVARAAEVDRQTLEEGITPDRDLLAAYPLLNSPLLVPGAAERNTTMVTYLFTDPSANIFTQQFAAFRYAAQINRPGDALVGVAGAVPAQIEQGSVVGKALPTVETVTLAIIALVVGVGFRSVVAPIVTLGTSAAGYLLADRAIAGLSGLLDAPAAVELEPIVVALILGITTDYSIFFLAGLQGRLREGEHNPKATLAAVREYLPIVLTAGLTVASGVAALVVARSGLFRELGPGLAVAVLVGLAVAVVAVPAAMAILGRWAFWPDRLRGAPERDRPRDARAGARRIPSFAALRARVIRRIAGDRRIAVMVAVVVVALLTVAALPLGGLRSAVAPVTTLPRDDPIRVATDAAAAGFTPGILSPTEVIVSKPDIAGQREALARLSTALRARPGVDVVLGPNNQPLPIKAGLFLAPDGNAARYLVAFNSDPLGATAIEELRALRADMPGLLADAGLAGAQTAYTGDTAVGMSLIDQADADLGRVIIAVGLVSLVLLMGFLRALVAPLYLLASSVLAVGAALGLTTFVFQNVLGHDGLVFFVPFAAAVLLVALGSDYNLFSVGYVWGVARRHPLPEAIMIAVPRSTRAISAAGLTLALSFAVLAVVPLSPFRELAFALAAGVLIDAFLVRSLLVPALITIVGPVSGWPTRLGGTERAR